MPWLYTVEVKQCENRLHNVTKTNSWFPSRDDFKEDNGEVEVEDWRKLISYLAIELLDSVSAPW